MHDSTHIPQFQAHHAQDKYTQPMQFDNAADNTTDE